LVEKTLNVPRTSSKRQLSNCPPASSAISLSFNGNNAITSGSSCTTYYFDVPSVGTDDLMVYVNSGSYIDIYLTRSEQYKGTNPSPDYNFESTGNQTFWIPNCIVAGTSKWYLNAKYSSTVNGTVSFALVTATPIPQATNEISGSLTESYRWNYGQFNPAGGDKGLQISFTISTTVDTFPEFYVQRGQCPTQSQKTSYTPYINTESPNQLIFFGIYGFDVFNTINYNISITSQPTQCETPQGMKVCSQYVNWQSTIWNATIVSQDESLIELILVLESPPASCTPTLTRFFCGDLFPKCDSNGFPELPCQSDCVDLEKDCGSILNGLNCSDTNYPPGVDTYCYLGSSSLLLPSIFLFLSLIIFSFLN